MIFADANVFLRFFLEPKNNDERGFAERANALFLRATTEEQVFTTTDAVIAEVVFVLTRSRHAQLDRAAVYELLIPVLRLPGCGIPGNLILQHALMFWISHSSISIVDAMCLANARHSDHELMTFDAGLERVHRRETRSIT